MTIVRCTRKLLAELRIKPDPEVTEDEAGWHAKLLRVERYHCVLFTHDETLFSFFVCRPDQLEFEHLPELFGQGLFKALLRSGFSQGQVETMLDSTRDIHFAKTNNRHVVGSMNDMARMLEWSVGASGGLAAADPVELQGILNETPFKAIGYDHPIERLRRLLDERAK